MSFPRYPAYKPSGVEWLGEVPEHWGILPVKRVASLQSGTGITSDSISEDATYPVFGGNGVRGSPILLPTMDVFQLLEGKVHYVGT